MKREVFNFTPHTINETIEGKSYPSIGNIRVSSKRYESSIGKILFNVVFGDLEGWESLYDIPDDSIIVVSAMVKNAHKEFFQDHAAYASLLISKQFILVSPGELVRDNEGKVIGCKGFDI